MQTKVGSKCFHVYSKFKYFLLLKCKNSKFFHYPSIQCAAVTSQLLSIIDAPHIELPSVISTCQGHELAKASNPPTIRSCSSGFIAGLPHA
jgi:hypothetical protein